MKQHSHFTGAVDLGHVVFTGIPCIVVDYALDARGRALLTLESVDGEDRRWVGVPSVEVTWVLDGTPFLPLGKVLAS